jgi:predicted patatin/cPLA2 family phospholipase
MRLVLEGGGTRAAYSAGVVHALHEAGVRPDVVVGSSSGSMNAAFFASGQTETLCRLWTETVPRERFISYVRLVTPWGPPGLDVDRMIDGVIAGGGLLDVQRAVSGRPALYVVSTEVKTGKARITRPSATNIFDWLRASHALPVGYNRLVTIDGEDFVDGGVAAPVPFDLPLDAEVRGPTVVILTRPMSTKKAPPNWWQQAFLRTVVPAPVAELSLVQHALHDALMTRLRAAVERGEVVVVDPPPEMTLKRITNDEQRLREGVRIGEEVGKRLAERLHAMQAQAGRAHEGARNATAASEVAE